jgi:hypothetical protein
MQLIDVTKAGAVDVLGAFADGPLPFCSDGF